MRRERAAGKSILVAIKFTLASIALLELCRAHIYNHEQLHDPKVTPEEQNRRFRHNLDNGLAKKYQDGIFPFSRNHQLWKKYTADVQSHHVSLRKRNR